MAEPVHSHENNALEAIKSLHRGYAGVASKLLIAHVVSDTIEILEGAKSKKLKTEEMRLRNAIAGKDTHAEKLKIRLELTKIAAEIATKSEAEIQADIKNLETINEPIISSSPDLIVQLADLKRSAKKGRTPKPTPTPPLVPLPVTPPPLPVTPPPLPVTPPPLPLVVPFASRGPAIMAHTNIPLGENHTHIRHHNPIAGSFITISGEGLSNPVTINIPHGRRGTPPPLYLDINLPGFDTKKPGVRNMKIVTTDPQDPNNTRTDNFDIIVEEDPHHLPDNRKIGEAAFLAATRATPRVYTLQNDDPAGRTYRIGRLKRAAGIGWWAEVPVLPGEEKWFGRTKTVKSTSRTGLYAKVREYLKNLNARAAAMNHGDHDEHEEHNEKHEKDNHAGEKHEKGEKHDKHEKSEEKHDKGGHAEGGDESSSGSFGAALKTVALAPVKLFNKQPAWVRGAEIGLGYALYSGGAVLLGPAVVAGAAVGASWWGLKKLWRIKNPPKGGGDSHGHH